MTRQTFEASFRDEIRKAWPDATDHETRIQVAEEYMHARFGEVGYEWSDDAARELARLYVQDNGEAG